MELGGGIEGWGFGLRLGVGVKLDLGAEVSLRLCVRLEVACLKLVEHAKCKEVRQDDHVKCQHSAR